MQFLHVACLIKKELVIQNVFTRNNRGEAEDLRPDQLQEAFSVVQAWERGQEAVREGVHAVRVQPDDPAADSVAGRPAVPLVQD